MSDIGRSKHSHVPIDMIFDAVRVRGFEPVQDDGTPWSGMLLGAKGRTSIALQKNGKPAKQGLHVQWEKMDGGKYEVNAYVL